MTEEFDIYLSPPDLTGREIIGVQRALSENWVGTIGPDLDRFEKELAAFVGEGRSALALNSGTAAIHLALLVLGVSPGDTVLCSSFTFVASANPIRYCGATPVFLDSDEETWNVSPVALEKALADLDKKGRRPKAAVLVDIYGQCADYDRLLPICARYGVPIVEDAAESLGARVGERNAGAFGELAVFSFNGNKILSAGGGGMLLGDQALLSRARFLATQARDRALHYQHSQIGYNYRMSNLLAAIGSEQLRVLAEKVQRRRRVFEIYRESLGDLSGVSFMPEAAYGTSTRWLTVMTVAPQRCHITPLQIVDKLARDRIQARPVWKPLHRQPIFADCAYYRGCEVSVSDRYFETGVCLPSGSMLSLAEQRRVCASIRELF